MSLQKELSLVSLIRDFIAGDPLLKKHIHCDPDIRDFNEVIGTCHPKNKVEYAIGFIAGRPEEGPPTVYVWWWTPKQTKTGLHYSRGMNPELALHPGDPQFFEKLKAGLLKGHDSLALYHKCKKLL